MAIEAAPRDAASAPALAILGRGAVDVEQQGVNGVAPAPRGDHERPAQPRSGPRVMDDHGARPPKAVRHTQAVLDVDEWAHEAQGAGSPSQSAAPPGTHRVAVQALRAVGAEATDERRLACAGDPRDEQDGMRREDEDTRSGHLLRLYARSL